MFSNIISIMCFVAFGRQFFYALSNYELHFLDAVAVLDAAGDDIEAGRVHAAVAQDIR